MNTIEKRPPAETVAARICAALNPGALLDFTGDEWIESFAEFMGKNSLFACIRALGVKFGNHESDLYIPDNEATRALLDFFPLEKSNAVRFRVQEGHPDAGQTWIDVPFAYIPHWTRRLKGNEVAAKAPTVLGRAACLGFSVKADLEGIQSILKGGAVLDLYSPKIPEDLRQELIALDEILQGSKAARIHDLTIPGFEPVTLEEAARIRRYEEERTNTDDWPEGSVILGKIPNFVSDCPGFVGTVFVAHWPAAAGAVTVWTQDSSGKLEIAGQSSW